MDALKTIACSVVMLGLFGAGQGSADELAVNGGFETGDTFGWTDLTVAPQTFTVESTSPKSGLWNGRIENTVEASGAVIKQDLVGGGTIFGGEDIRVSFWARGAGAAGGVQLAELFSIGDSGVTKTEILGGGPLNPPSDTDWTFYSFDTTVGPDVTFGVTLQFAAVTGANPGSTSTFELDDVSILLPEFGRGDYNSSGQVEQGDLDLVLLNWGIPHDPPPAGWTNDFPTPEKIDQDELDGVLLNWGNSTSAVATAGVVPEPTSLVLLVLAGLGFFYRGAFTLRRDALVG